MRASSLSTVSNTDAAKGGRPWWLSPGMAASLLGLVLAVWSSGMGARDVTPDTPELRSFACLRERLGLTAEQAARVAPVFAAEARLRREAAARLCSLDPQAEELLAYGRELERIEPRTEARLLMILSPEQMATYRELTTARRELLRFEITRRLGRN